jgi:hypothetical protein
MREKDHFADDPLDWKDCRRKCRHTQRISMDGVSTDLYFDILYLLLRLRRNFN